MPTPAEMLRERLNEEIPVGGADTDTLFLDEAINNLLLAAGDDVEVAAGQGWIIKAGKLADLVDTAEGTSKRAMSDLHKNALAMVAAYNATLSGGAAVGRTRSKPLIRR